MSSDLSLKLILNASQPPPEYKNNDGHPQWVAEIISKEINALSANIPEWQQTPCLLQDLGDFLTRTTTLLSQLAEKVVNGDEVMEYANNRIREMEEEQDLSELRQLDYMNDKHHTLKYAIKSPTCRLCLHIFFLSTTQVCCIDTSRHR